MNTAVERVDLPRGTEVPHLPSSRLLGHLTELRADPLGLLLRARCERGDLVRVRMGPIRAYYASHPADVEHILVENHQSYSKETRGYDTLEVFLGKGLVTSEGDLWRRQRRIAQPAFAKRRIAALGEVMRAASQRLVLDWSANASDGALVDVPAEMMHLTLRIAGLTLFSVDLAGASADIGRNVAHVLSDFNRLFKSIVPYPQLWPTPANFRGRRALAELDRVVYGIIEERRRQASAGEAAELGSDLLSMFMEARDEETGEGMSDRQLRDEIITMLVAGHETTANALTWTLTLLARHPEVMARVHDELDRVVGDAPVELAHLPQLAYTEQVFKESIRLYPPVWALARRAKAPDVLSGYTIPAGSYVILSPYATHRHPAFWPDPERFDPDRFEGGDRSRPKGAYFPFASGPRKCIGDHFAKMEGLVVLASLLQRFRVRLVPGQSLRPEPSVTLRPEGSIWMVVEHR